MEVTYETQTLIEVPSVQIYEIRGKYQKLIQQGSLQVLEIEKFNLNFLKLHGFQYTLRKDIPIMTQAVKNENGLPLKMFVLPGVDQFYYGLIIDQTHKDETEVFEFIMANKCKLVEPQNQAFEFFKPRDGQVQQQVQQNQPKNEEEMLLRSGLMIVQPNVLQQRSEAAIQAQYGGWNNVGVGVAKRTAISEYIMYTGTMFKDGLVAGAKIMAQGVVAGGQYLQGKITTHEQKEIDPSTINKLKLASTGTKAMYMYTKAQVEALVKMGVMVGEEVGKQVAQSETGQKLQQHRNYDDVKEIGKATFFAFVTVYDGLYEALSELGNSCAQASTGLINARYGGQAAELSREGFEVAGNVGQITRVYKDVAAKAAIQELDPKLQKK